MNPNLSVALAFHQAGRHADAARCYHTLLTRDPDDADALHLFGVMHHQCGHGGRAAELIVRALALRPGAAAFHANLGEVYRNLGRHEEAVDCCRTALGLQADYPEAANNLGLALQALGRREEAVESFGAALRMRPGFALARNNLGLALRELGRSEQALEAFRAAVDLDSALAIARANLGQALVDAGEPAEALPHCEEAVRLQPDLAAAHNNLGNAFIALERWPEAHAAYAEALRLSPDLGDARIHANLGLALQRENQFPRAFACFRRAVELASDDPAIWQYLANAHAADDDYAAAIPCCERIVALAPTRPHGYVDLGWALQDEGRLSEAANCYRKALELQPDGINAHVRQGGLHEELGEMAEAESCYRRARELDPEAPAPMASLATLLRGKLPDADREAIRARLEDPRLDDAPRSNLLFGLAHACDARGEHAEAVLCLERANALAMDQRRKQGRHYDEAEHTRFVDRLIEAFTPERFAGLADVGDDTRRPVFVFGMPRSGTTLVEQVLSSHSRVHGAGELRLVRQTFDAIPEVVGRNDGMLPCLDALDAPGVRELSRRHLAGLQSTLDRVRPGFAPDRVVDKMTDNYLYLGLIAVLFPRATLIHVRRDPRDIALSCWMTNFRSIRWANDPDHLAARIRDHHRLAALWQGVLPSPVHTVFYERLVDDFEAEARRLIAACGLDWEPACLQFHQTARPVRTASVTQVRKPLYRRSLARWKHYESHLAELFSRLPEN
ncbi:MAG: tetratricopeptide repeat protein [Isosphaeraceae bacterium]